MSDIAIKVEGLSKQYRIGERESYKALRDVITDAASAPFRRLRSAFRNGNGSTAAADSSLITHHSSLITHDSSLKNSFWALDDVSFEVKRGEVVGIIGRNGAGKSTLLKILSRITKPTRGHATIHGRVGSLLEVGTGFHPELTGRENIYLNAAVLGMRKAEVAKKFDEIVAFAEVDRFIDTPVKRYSSGMYVRLAFAVAAHLEPEIFVIDEVLAVGDATFQKKCLGKLGDVAKAGRTVVFVSHDMTAVQNLCSRVVRLDKGRAVSVGPTMQEIESYVNDQEIAFGISGSHWIPLATNLHLSRFEITPNPVASTQPITLNLELNSMSARIRELLVLIYDSLNRRVGVLDLRSPDGSYKISEDRPLLITAHMKSLPMVEGNYYLGLWVNADVVFSNFFNLITLSVMPNASVGLTPYHPGERGIVEFDYEFLVAN